MFWLQQRWPSFTHTGNLGLTQEMALFSRVVLVTKHWGVGRQGSHPETVPESSEVLCIGSPCQSTPCCGRITGLPQSPSVRPLNITRGARSPFYSSCVLAYPCATCKVLAFHIVRLGETFVDLCNVKLTPETMTPLQVEGHAEPAPQTLP